MGRPKKNQNEVDILGIEPVPQINNEGHKEVPIKYSPEWSNYVLSLLTDEESLQDDNGRILPFTDGLRRIAQEMVDGFIFSGISHIHYVSETAAAVTWQIEYNDPTIGVVCVQGSAEAGANNLEYPFSKYPLATAETRAEGRALKRLLGLCKVLTVDEISKSEPKTNVNPFVNNQANDSQVKFIELMCQKLNLGVMSVVNSVYPTLTTINDLKYEQAQSLSGKLQEWAKNPELFQSLNLPKFDKNYRV